MEPIDIIIASKIEKLNITKEQVEIAKRTMEACGVENGSKYFKNAAKLKKTAKLRGINLEMLNEIEDNNSLKKFIETALHSFDKILNTSNKADKAIINSLNGKKLPLDDFCLLTEKKKDYKMLIKQKNIDFSKHTQTLKNAIDNDDLLNFKVAIEYQNDDIEKSILESTANKLKRSIISNKYKHLVNKETEEIFLECAKQDVTKEQFRESIAPKIAAMRNPDDFNELLGQVIGMNITWEADALTKKADKNNTDVLKNEDGIVYLEVNNFSDSQAFGSRMWCITREDEFLQSYLYNQNSRVVFRLDTNKDIRDPESYIALLYKGTELNEVYDKNDKLFFSKDALFEKMNNIKIPMQSDESKIKKIAQYNKIVKDPEEFNMKNITYLTLIDLKAFELLDFYEKNKETFYEWTQYNLYSSENSEKALINHIAQFDEEQIDYILKSPSKEILSGTISKTKDVVFGEILKTTKDPKMIDKVLNNMDLKIETKQNNKILIKALGNNNETAFKHFINRSNELGIDLSNVFGCQANKNISDYNLILLDKNNNSFLYNAFEREPQRTFINCFSNEERSVEMMATIMKSNSMKQDSVKVLKDKFESRINKEKNNNNLSDKDNNYLKAIEVLKKNEKRLKLR